MPDSVAKRYIILLFDESNLDKKEQIQCDYIVKRMFESQSDRRTFWQYHISHIVVGAAFITIFINLVFSQVACLFRRDKWNQESIVGVYL